MALIGSAVVHNLATLTPRPVSWLWPDRVARGKVTLLAGDPGLGKSYLTLDLAARVTTGHLGHLDEDGLPKRSSPGKVLLLSAEDDAADTILPRLTAMGGDPSKVCVLKGVDRGDDRLEACRLDRDMRPVWDTVLAMSGVRLVVIDPISAYLGEKNANNNAEVRSLLAELAAFAENSGIAVVCVTHLNKDSANQKKVVYRAIGSLAFAAAARMAWLVAKHPDDPDKRVFSLIKSNITGPVEPLAFRIKDNRVEWLDERVPFQADELEGGPEETDRAGAFDEACGFLRVALADGPRPAAALLAEAEGVGVSPASVKRARRALGVTSNKGPGRADPWVWAMPTGGRVAASDPSRGA